MVHRLKNTRQRCNSDILKKTTIARQSHTHLLLELSAARRMGAGEEDDADVCARCRAYSATVANNSSRSVAETSMVDECAAKTRIMSSAAEGAVKAQEKGTSDKRCDAGTSSDASAAQIAESSFGMKFWRGSRMKRAAAAAERDAATMGPGTVDCDDSDRVLLLLVAPAMSDMLDQNTRSCPGQLFMQT